MFVGFSWTGKIVLLASLKHDLLYHCKKPQPVLLPTLFIPFLGTSWSVQFSPSASQASPASLQTVFVLICVIQDAGIRRAVTYVCSNTSSRRRRESCSLQLQQEFSMMLLILLSFFSFCTSCLLFYTLSEQSLRFTSCEPCACYCFSSSWPAFPSLLALTFLVLIRHLVMVVFCQQAGWPRGICRERLAHTLSTYLPFLLVFCCLFSSSNHAESRPCYINCFRFQAGFLNGLESITFCFQTKKFSNVDLISSADKKSLLLIN